MGRQSFDAMQRLGVVLLQYGVGVAIGETEAETWGALR